MQDVAAAAGVHQTTVSRALRNDPRIPEATRRRIVALAERMRYRPHPLVSALIAVRRSRLKPHYPVPLAFIVPGQRQGRRYRPNQYTYEAHFSGARTAAEELGYSVELFPMGAEGMTERRINGILATRSIPGVIIGSFPEAHGNFELEWSRLCGVVIEYTWTRPALDRVVHDSYDGMRRIMQECRARGIFRVGLALTAAGDERTEQLNGAAFWVEQKSRPGFAAIAPHFRAAWDESAFARWHRRHQIEAVVTSNALLPEIMSWATRRGLRLGRDLQLINVNADREGTVAGIYQDPFTIGATAARMLIDKIGRNERGVPLLRHSVLTQGTWLDGRGTLLRIDKHKR